MDRNQPSRSAVVSRWRVWLLVLLFPALFSCGTGGREPLARPNIVLIITDDQGWAQVGVHGNEILQTPHLDALASQGVEFTRFYVSPACAPTRASLLTGRYNYRTGVVDTYLGRAMMHADEVTLAEMLSSNGYRTGIFGKWHLGDNYPLRPIDQGFQEAVVHKGGGIGQPSDPPGNSYFDPILQVNGRAEKFEGYCTDIFFQQALDFLERHRDQPFFIYLPTNAPHSPYDVPDSYIEPYLKQGLSEKDARIYGMITNIDENVGRLLDKLDALELRDHTIVIFMTDNGPTTQHFTAGLRDQKSSVYEGGIRVPFFLRWPGRFSPRKIDTIAAHIDVVPTLLEATGTPKPGEVLLDGRSLLPLLTGSPVPWPERVIYIQSHRGNEPQLYRNFAAISQRFKLVQPLSFRQEMPPDPVFELYDIEADPGERTNLAETHPAEVERLKRGYEQWFQMVSESRGYDPPRIYVGTEQENPVILTRQDWRVLGEDGWGDSHLGFWWIHVARPGDYEIRFEFSPGPAGGTAELKIQDTVQTRSFGKEEGDLLFGPISLQAGDAKLEATLRREGEPPSGVRYVQVRRLGN